MSRSPEALLYAKTHEWTAITEDHGVKIATVGISAFAVEQLTDLVFMELPTVGASVNAGGAFGEVESVKAVSDIYCPVTGVVTEVNTALPDDLEILTSDPYDQGWIAKIEITDDAGMDQLMDFAAYQKQCESES